MPQNIKAFINKWTGRGNEKQETQQYWNGLIFDVLNAPTNTEIQYEKPVKINGQTKFIDAYLPDTRVLIEQKSLGIDLMKAETQSDGMKLTPYEQGRRYGGYLPYDEQPRWIIDCNFEELRVHDMKKPGEAPEVIYLKDLGKDYTRLGFMIDTKDEHLKKELELSLKAGELVGKIHDRFLEQYNDPMAKKTQNSLNVLCTRLVFCLYAEDAGIFGSKDVFTEYISHYAPGDIRQALLNLFKVLDTPEDERADLYLSDELAAFPYCNGGLFANENIVIPKITQEIKDTLIDAANFNWSEISPTIFGAVFESTLNNETRRAGGMHYTSIENIHKVIDPLFLNDLKAEFTSIMEIKVPKTKETKLRAYQDKLSSFKFLDPACGSGNFLTETYISLRRLENDVLRELHKGQIVLGDAINPIKVSISQFYGFEINDFAVTVAKTALWIAESQMMKETEDIVSMHLDFLPLKTNATIIECNALRIDWWRYVDKHSLSYIMGNPPFSGFKYQSKEQHADIEAICKGKIERYGLLDYVCGWYVKAAEYIQNTSIECAFVSTNSITQGEQPSILWSYLLKLDIEIRFAYSTFVWNSESNDSASVHCVIIGFGHKSNLEKRLFNGNNIRIVKSISPYMIEGEPILVYASKTPIAKDVHKMIAGNKTVKCLPLIMTPEEKDELIAKEPNAEKYIKKMIGSQEFINSIDRYCLWLVDCPPSELIKMPLVMERVEKVREERLKSKDKQAHVLANTPATFRDTNNPDNAIVVPLVSSERRRYIPMGYIDSDTIANNKVSIIPDGTLYEFGMITSNVHNAWMRVVAMRMKSDYSYSLSMVYNTFPWPTPTDSQKSKIEATAQGILNARKMYPDSSLADMYGEKMYLFTDLVKAHQANDRAVMEAYGFSLKMTEQECVAELMKMYQKLVDKEK